MIMLWLYIYDLPVSLSQVNEDGYMYRSKGILTKNIHQNHPAPIPQGADSAAVELAQQQCFERASQMV